MKTFTVDYYRNPRSLAKERAEREALKARFTPLVYDSQTIQKNKEELARTREIHEREYYEVR